MRTKGTITIIKKGKSAIFELTWDDKKHELAIGGRKGSFDGMVKKRWLNIVIVKEGAGTGLSETEGKKVEYTGLGTW